MNFIETYLWAFPLIMAMMTLVWIGSVIQKNASIVDPFWGLGFVLAAWYYFLEAGDFFDTRSYLVAALVTVWGTRLSMYLFLRNLGKAEDYRYREFREKYGPHRYWWVSFFQVFLLQGFLLWLVSAPLLGAMYYSSGQLWWLDYVAVAIWLIGFVFEAGGDFQLARFKANPANKGKVLQSGFWKYTRHPNYFGDSAVWWAYGLFAFAGDAYLTALGSVLMTFLIIKISGVALLEKSQKNKKPEYVDYIRRTSAFIPWFPKK